MDPYDQNKKKSIALSSGLASNSNDYKSSQNAYPLTGARDGVSSINQIVAGIKGDISNL